MRIKHNEERLGKAVDKLEDMAKKNLIPKAPPLEQQPIAPRPSLCDDLLNKGKTMEAKKQIVSPQIRSSNMDEISRELKKIAMGTELNLKPITLGVTMITKGERTLSDAINSVSEFADEIVIVHTETDVPPTYCHKKVKVFCYPWDGDFSKARNFAKSKCTCDYFMWVDSDDIIPWPSGQYLKAAFDEPGRLTFALKTIFSLNVICTENGKPIGTSLMQPRIAPNIPQITFEGKVHESYMQSVLDYGLQETKVKNIYVHHSGYDSEALHLEKMERNLSILVGMEETPLQLYHLGNTYYCLKKFKEAQFYWSKLVKIKDLDDQFRDQAQYCLGMAYFSDSDYHKAIDCFKESEKQDAVYWKAEAYMRQERYELAESQYTQYLGMDRAYIDHYGTNVVRLRYNAYKRLLEIHKIRFDDVKDGIKTEYPEGLA